jgi:pimeloyl-ACP methyl ester carboxylesterase
VRPRPALALPLALALGLGACSSPSTEDSLDLPSCADAPCTGTIAGAAYEILLPDTWNGTLLLYSHGYRAPQPVPPAFDPVSTDPEPAPGWSSGERRLADELLRQGYALAGSSYASNGWAVEDGVRAGQDLIRRFRDEIAVPRRTLLWGDSLGGLITQSIAEASPDLVDGAAPLCGVLAGVVPNMDLALDVAFGVRELLEPDLKIVGFDSYEDAVGQVEAAARAVEAARSDRRGRSALLTIAALVDAPAQTQRSDGATAASRVDAAAEGVLVALGFGILARYDVEQRFGGNISDNTNADYAARISAQELDEIDAIGAGSGTRLVATIEDGDRVSADPQAREAAQQRGGDPSGAVSDPTITLHTAADPLVLAQNSALFVRRTAGSPLVRELYTVAPTTYPEDPGAPYGAGHCSFTPESRLGVVALLADWVESGTAPDDVAVTDALGPASGLDLGHDPGPWPDPLVSE